VNKERDTANGGRGVDRIKRHSEWRERRSELPVKAVSWTTSIVERGDE
jgi:hypothetical protein